MNLPLILRKLLIFQCDCRSGVSHRFLPFLLEEDDLDRVAVRHWACPAAKRYGMQLISKAVVVVNVPAVANPVAHDRQSVGARMVLIIGVQLPDIGVYIRRIAPAKVHYDSSGAPQQQKTKQREQRGKPAESRNNQAHKKRSERRKKRDLRRVKQNKNAVSFKLAMEHLRMPLQLRVIFKGVVHGVLPGVVKAGVARHRLLGNEIPIRPGSRVLDEERLAVLAGWVSVQRGAAGRQDADTVVIIEIKKPAEKRRLGPWQNDVDQQADHCLVP